MFISELFRKVSVSMISGILYVVMLCDLVYQLINSLVFRLTNVKFDVSHYTVMGNMTNLTMNSGKEDVVRTVLVAVIYMIVFLL